MKKTTIAFLFLLSALFVKAQVTTTNIDDLGIFPVTGSKVKIIQDEKLNTILKNHIASNQKQTTIAGWRVQIFLGNGHDARDKGNAMKAEFIKKFPDIDTYLVYEAPHFKVRVGDCRTRADALKLKKLIEGPFPNTWIVEDRISLPKL